MDQSIKDLMNMFRPEMARYENARFAVSQSYNLAFQGPTVPAESDTKTRIALARIIQKEMFKDLEDTISLLDTKEAKHGPSGNTPVAAPVPRHS